MSSEQPLPIEPRLPGVQVLVVEDQYLVADSLCFLLEGLGARVLGPAPTVARALELSAQAPDAAVLDVDLRGECSAELALRLRQRGVAVVFLTGYEPAERLPEELRSLPALSKPVDGAQLARALRAALGERDGDR